MQGSKPAARRLAQPSPHSQCLADGGSVGFGARGLNELRQMVPLVEAMGYRPQPPAPAPASDTRAAQLLAMIPKMEAMGYRQAAAPQVPQYFAKGGMVRGPGTGTSDSIATEAEPGTFIMPADSTKAIGPSALEKLGTMPVRLSDGEFKLPPEQVMALGAAVLKLMKDATHKPVNGEDGGQTDAEVGEGGGEEMGEGAAHEQAEAAAGGVEDDPEEGAQGFQPGARERMARMPMFADGGPVGYPMQRLDIGQWAQEQEQGRADLAQFEARQAKIRQDQADADAEAVAQSEEFKRRQQAGGGTPVASFADGGLVDPRRPNSFGDAAAVAADPGVTQVRTSAADTFGSAPAPAPAAAPAPAVGSNLAAATRMGAYTDPRSTLYDPNPFAASNAAKIAAAGQSSRATIEAGMPPAPALPTASNSFGDAAAATNDASVTQVAGGQPGTGTVSTVPAQPLSAAASTTGAQGVGYQSAAQRMASAPPAPAAPLGWSDRNAQRNQEVSLSSIANRPEWQKSPQRATDAGAAPPIPQPSGPTPLTQQVSQMPSTFQSKAAYGFQPRRYADGGMVEDDLQKRPQQVPLSVAAGEPGGGGGSGGGGGAGGATGSWHAPEPAPTATPGALTRAAGAGRGLVNPAPVAASPAADAMSGGIGLQPGGVTRTGNSYTGPANISGDITVNGQAPGGGAVSTQSAGNPQSLSRRGAADAMALMPNAPAPIQAPTIRHSGNDWQARNDLRNLEVSAKSIMNRPEWSKAGMGRFNGQQGPSVETAAYQSALANDLALRAAQPGMDQAAMRENADLQRAGLQTAAQAAESAANRQNDLTRTLIGERGANQRATISALGTTEAARIKAAQENKAPPGYRYTVGGNMEAIPGGPADLKQNKEGAQQSKDTQDIFSILNEARPLLSAATGSLLGTGFDKAVSAFGGTTDGAAATAQLKALQGALISKMPKMTGPQSDKDVQLYREMAGQIGDSTIPAAQRNAAMNTIEQLNLKYLPQAAGPDDLAQMPSGAWFRAPDGSIRRKP